MTGQLLLLGCDLGPPLRKIRHFSPLGINEVQCIGIRKETSQVIVQIRKLKEKADLVRTELGLSNQYLIFNPSISFLNELLKMEKSVEHPLILSEERLKDFFKLIELGVLQFNKENVEYLKHHLFDEGPDRIPEISEKMKFTEILFYIDQLSLMSNRFAQKNCEFEELALKKDTDILKSYPTYLEIVKNEEILQSFSQWDSLDLNDKNNLLSLKDGFLSLCEKVGALPETCLLDSSLNFIKYKKFLDENFFGLKKKNRPFKCTKSDEKYIIEIPFKESSLYPIEKMMELENDLNSVWGKNKITLKLIKNFDQSKGFEIVNSPSLISYVSEQRPLTIFLSTHLEGYEKRHLITHEFGHVLGFGDCYVEYYNQNSKELIYYELETGNLMCSLEIGAKISTNYDDKIIQNYCNN